MLSANPKKHPVENNIRDNTKRFNYGRIWISSFKRLYKRAFFFLGRLFLFKVGIILIIAIGLALYNLEIKSSRIDHLETYLISNSEAEINIIIDYIINYNTNEYKMLSLIHI